MDGNPYAPMTVIQVCLISGFQVQRLETLLSKCKETMQVNKERQKTMLADKQALASTLSLTQEELQKSKVTSMHGSQLNFSPESGVYTN